MAEALLRSGIFGLSALLQFDRSLFGPQSFRRNSKRYSVAAVAPLDPAVCQKLRYQFRAVRQVGRAPPFFIAQILHELPFAMRDWRLLVNRSLELDADPILPHPGNPAGSNCAIAFDHELKVARYVTSVGYVDGRALVGKVDNPAARTRASNRNEGDLV